MSRSKPMKLEIEHAFLAGALGIGAYFWLRKSPSRVATHGTVQLRAGVPYRFTYQTAYPIWAETPTVTTSQRQNTIRNLLTPWGAYDILFTRRPGLVDAPNLVTFISAPPRDVTATIGTPLEKTPADGFDLRLLSIERLDGGML